MTLNQALKQDFSVPGIKRSLKDQLHRPLKALRISVIDRCNLRCPYCMPEKTFPQAYDFLEAKKLLAFEEITRLVRLFVMLGVTKVRITGGEPLLRKNLPVLLRSLRAIKGIEDLALTTNGVLLERYAPILKDAGLQRITVSLDSLDRKVFQQMNGGKTSPERILTGIQKAQEAGLTPVKINVVVQKGINDHVLLDLIDYFGKRDGVVRFIEYMDTGSKNHWDPSLVVPSRVILEKIQKKFTLIALESQYHGEVAKRYHVLETGGEIGFISSVSEPFCGSCTRVRLSADGKLYACLFAGEGLDLRTMLREGLNDTAIIEKVEEFWEQRQERYSEVRFSGEFHFSERKKIEMYQIGG